MGMILHSTEVNINKITGPSMNAFMDDVTIRRIQITDRTTSHLPTGALQMGCNE